MRALQKPKHRLIRQGLRDLVHQLPELHEVGVGSLEVSGGTHDAQDAFLPLVREGDRLVVAFDGLIHLVFVQVGIALEVELEAVVGGLVDADPELGGEDVVDLGGGGWGGRGRKGQFESE